MCTVSSTDDSELYLCCSEVPPHLLTSRHAVPVLLNTTCRSQKSNPTKQATLYIQFTVLHHFSIDIYIKKTKLLMNEVTTLSALITNKARHSYVPAITRQPLSRVVPLLARTPASPQPPLPAAPWGTKYPDSRAAQRTPHTPSSPADTHGSSRHAGAAQHAEHQRTDTC